MYRYQITYDKVDWLHGKTTGRYDLSCNVEAECIEEAELKFIQLHPFEYNNILIMNLDGYEPPVFSPVIKVNYSNTERYWVEWWKLMNERSFELFMTAQNKMLAK